MTVVVSLDDTPEQFVSSNVYTEIPTDSNSAKDESVSELLDPPVLQRPPSREDAIKAMRENKTVRPGKKATPFMIKPAPKPSALLQTVKPTLLLPQGLPLAPRAESGIVKENGTSATDKPKYSSKPKVNNDTVEKQVAVAKNKRAKQFVTQRENRKGQRKAYAVATWAGVELARSLSYEIYDGKVLFPERDVNKQYLVSAGEKGQRFYNPLGPVQMYNVVVQKPNSHKPIANKMGAWQYENPKGIWKPLAMYIGFWKGVQTKHDRAQVPLFKPDTIAPDDILQYSIQNGKSLDLVGSPLEVPVGKHTMRSPATSDDDFVRRKRLSFRDLILSVTQKEPEDETANKPKNNAHVHIEAGQAQLSDNVAENRQSIRLPQDDQIVEELPSSDSELIISTQRASGGLSIETIDPVSMGSLSEISSSEEYISEPETHPNENAERISLKPSQRRSARQILLDAFPTLSSPSTSQETNDSDDKGSGHE